MRLPGAVRSHARARLGTLLTYRTLQVRSFFALPPWLDGYRLTWRRRANLWLNRWETQLRAPRLRSFPPTLVVEPTNTCNLRCPYCFTGAGDLGRRHATMSLALYRKLLDELGAYLFQVKLYNWGEPLLCRHLVTMIADAHDRGISTLVNTNLSLPFDGARADALVASGLTEIVVAIDGARQDTYERYRVGGRLERVLENVELLRTAKRRAGSNHPRIALECHVFPWNTDEVAAVEALGCARDLEVRTYKGNVPGAEWDPDGPWHYCDPPRGYACINLWSIASIAADGGVKPCYGSFFSDDDFARLDPAALEATTFREVWNNPQFQRARGFFRRREATPEEQHHVCFECPNTRIYERWREHRAAGGDPFAFDAGFSSNDLWNHFWRRREGRGGRHAG